MKAGVRRFATFKSDLDQLYNMLNRLPLLAAFLVPLILISGCVGDLDLMTTSKVLIAARQNQIVDNFLNQYPYADTKLTYYSEDEFSQISSIIKEKCDKDLTPRPFYHLKATKGDVGVEVWIDWDNEFPECVYALGGYTPEEPTGAGITRTITPVTVAPGGTITVTLSVDVEGKADYYAIDDIYPSGFTVIDKGEGSTEHTGHWKYIVIENAQNTQLSYTLQAPAKEGEYFFSGEYMFGGVGDPVPVAGQSKVYVGSSGCTDSDGGSNIHLKGITTGYSEENEYISKEDVCDSTIVDGDMFYGKLYEYKCVYNRVKEVEQTCLYGCEDGACINISKVIEETETCTDSDGGSNYYKRGVTISTRGAAIDACLNKGSDLPEHQNTLNEYICNEDGDVYGGQNYECPYGCRDGACIKSTECELYYTGLFVGGAGPKIIRINGKDHEVELSFVTSDDQAYLLVNGEGESLMKGEAAHFQNIIVYMEEVFPISNTLGNAQIAIGETNDCITSDTEVCGMRVCTSDGWSPCMKSLCAPSCTDSDEMNYFEKGYIVVTGQTHFNSSDYCYTHDEDSVVEHYCSGVEHISMIYECPNGCSDGTCLL